jgi:predicted RNase H-like HicB family nuclease
VQRNPLESFLVVVEELAENFSAFIPDIPGCVATGSSYDEAVTNISTSYQALIEALSPEARADLTPHATTAFIHRFR